MLYIPMPERIENYGWNAMNCYDWTPWLDILVDMIESAKCIDLGLMSQDQLSRYVYANELDEQYQLDNQKRRTDASITDLTAEQLEEYKLTQRWLNR